MVTRAGEHALDILEDFLHYDPEKRPNAQQSLRYPYFQSMRRPSVNKRMTTYVNPQQILPQNNIQQIRIVNPAEISNKPLQNGRASKLSYISTEALKNEINERQNEETKSNFSVYNPNTIIKDTSDLLSLKSEKIKYDPNPKYNEYYVKNLFGITSNNNGNLRSFSIYDPKTNNNSSAKSTNGYYLNGKIQANGDSKVYNAFSKISNPSASIIFNESLNRNLNKEEGLSARNRLQTHSKIWDTTETDDLDKILG